MKKIVLICATAMMSFAMVSCGGADQQPAPAKKEVVKEGVYMAYPERGELHWTAFKFTERVGVSGTFDEIQARGASEASSPMASLVGTEFRIHTKSVNSKSEDRDTKLKSFFFGTMKGGEVIQGKFSSFHEEQNKCVVDLVLNGKRQSMRFDYKLDDKTINIHGRVDLSHFDAMNSVRTINKKCEVLHKGSDGVSKLWPDVDVRVSIPYLKK